MGKNKKQHYDVIVIGAGAAGMVAAITAARNGKKVIILEKLDKAGKKLLATGNGKCNFTNAKMSADCYGGDRSFIEGILTNYGVKEILDFFHSIGIYPMEKNGYYYPNSEQATSVVYALLDELDRLHVTIAYGQQVNKIQPSSHGVNVFTTCDTFSCNKLIIATGLKASPKLGSDGNMFNVIKELGHRFTPVLPALCGYYCKGIDFKKISGVRARGTVHAKINGNIVASDTGEMQFTDYGLSGIPVFQISRFLSKALYAKENVEIELNLLPEFDKETLINELNFRKDRLKCRKEHLLNGLLNQKLADMLLHSMKEEFSTEMLANKLRSITVSVTEYRDYEFAQVCTGGIPVVEVHPETLESVFIPNIHFAGEILDVDGICGGYNLHFAWATGLIAGNATADH